MNPDPKAEFLTVDAAAALLRINRKTLYEAIKAGQIPAIRLGRVLRVHRLALLKLAGVTNADES